mmetsp:Transcript_27570/g.64630  ORF Transcript_27570/g.64630 Transcript_27570/m.64630 type:complete len:213 (+) Transcript_27570:253-891(+)
MGTAPGAAQVGSTDPGCLRIRDGLLPDRRSHTQPAGQPRHHVGRLSVSQHFHTGGSRRHGCLGVGVFLPPSRHDLVARRGIPAGECRPAGIQRASVGPGRAGRGRHRQLPAGCPGIHGQQRARIVRKLRTHGPAGRPALCQAADRWFRGRSRQHYPLWGVGGCRHDRPAPPDAKRRSVSQGHLAIQSHGISVPKRRRSGFLGGGLASNRGLP